MRLTIENKSLKKIVLNASLGWVDPVTTRVLEVTIAQLEAVRTRLVTLQSAGLIVFTTEASGNSDDDAAEGATVSIASSGGGGGVPTTRQINTVAPLAGGGDLSANRFLSISAATTLAAGSMSAADKTKLDGIEAGAQVNDVSSVAGKTGAVTLDTDDINVPTVGSPTHITQLTNAYDHFWSAGSITGFELTDNGDGTVNIAAGESLLRDAAVQDAPLHVISVAAVNNLVLVDGAANYIYTDWNGGVPTVATSTVVTDFNCLDKCLLWTVCREGTELHVLDGRRMNVDANRKHRRVLLEAERFRKTATGTVIGTPGSRNLTLTAGRFYYALNQVDHGAYDTSVAGTALANVFRYYYRNGSGGWTTIGDQKQINNLNYDNGTGVLATLTNNRFRTDWIYLVLGATQRLVVLMGRNNSNSLAEAVAAQVPSDLPPTISNASVLVGQVVIQRDGVALASVSSAFEKIFVTAPAVEHNNLAGLQGGAIGEYVHLTSAQVTKLDGIEAGADVTDAVNVAAAGAVMTPAGGSDGDLLAKSGSTVVWTAPSGGGGSGATLRGIRITASGSYYERAIGHLLGGDAATGWETFAVVILDLVEGGGYGTREVISTTNEFVGPGYMIGVSDARPVHAITAGDGSRFGNFTGWWARGNQGKALAFLGLGFDQAASQRFAQLNGQDFFRGSMTGFSSAAATLPYRVGANAGTGTAPCLGMTILAIGHKQNGVLTDTQRQDIIRTFLTTGALPASVFTNLFNFSSLALGAAPATISDEIGAQDLTRVGTDIQVVDDFYASIAIRQTPEPDMIVTVGGATFTGRVILPSTTGAAVVVDGAEYVFSSTSGGAATVNLGTPTTGRRIVVKDNDGNAATNNITVSPGSGTIDGQPNHVINTNWGSVTFIGNGTNWRVIATI